MPSNTSRWVVGVILAFHLGIGIGVFATKWLSRVPDLKQACIQAIGEELRRTPRLEWQQ